MTDQSSSTALLVARGVYLASCEPRFASLVPRQMKILTGQLLAGSSSRFIDLASHSWFRWICFFTEKLVLPGICLHYVLRKKFIEERARRAIAEGYQNIIVFGAGFDTLALRLSDEFPAVAFYEIDHPATQANKRELLAEKTLPSNLHLLPYDLSQPDQLEQLAEVLHRHREEHIFFVAEGLLMYLPESEIKKLFAFAKAGSGQRRFMFSAMNMLPNGHISFTRGSTLIRWWLDRKQEPFTWGLAPSDAQEWLVREDFQLLENAGPEELMHEFHVSPNEKLAKGEYLYVAQGI